MKQWEAKKSSKKKEKYQMYKMKSNTEIEKENKNILLLKKYF